MKTKIDSQTLPVEVQLAWEVMTCKAMRETYDDQNQPCRYFNRHFGPYLAYDWLQADPENSDKGIGDSVIPVQTNGIRYSVPALCGGCRKAPLMTIGINPNMASWQLNTNGSSWAYPYFDNISEYATYYRFQTIYQEKFDLDFIKRFIDVSSAVKAPKAGIINDIQYNEAQDGFDITVLYDGDTTETKISQPRQAVVLVDKKVRFAVGDLLAGIVNFPIGQDTDITQQPVGYHVQFASIFDKAKTKLISTGKIPSDANLHTGEDVLLGDMVACASPGWTAASGGVPEEYRDAITKTCCGERGWLALQFQQTNPSIIIFSGTSAFSMFQAAFSGVKFNPDFPSDLSGPYSWLRFTLNNRVMMTVEEGATPTRIIISPHFSYKVNFTPCYAFTVKEWNIFQTNWPFQAALLNGKPSSGQVLISLSNPNATQEKMGPAWPDLYKQYIDPCEMIAEIIVDEFNNGTIGYDSDTKHFKRTDGTCQFCQNQLFSVGQECPYGKDNVSGDSNQVLKLKSAADRMIRG